MLLFMTQMVFLVRYICFFNSAEYACLEQREPVSNLNNLSCRRYSFQKLTQFTQGNKVIDATASNTDSFSFEGYMSFFNRDE
jgi:hypothetical protein